MHKQHFAPDSNAFYNKFKQALENENECIVALVYFDRKVEAQIKTSTDEEELLIKSGWQRFLEVFSLPCCFHRLEWISYLLLIEGKPEEIVLELKQAFTAWEQELYPHIWKIAFISIKEMKDDRDNNLPNFYNIFQNGIRYYYPFERFFCINMDQQQVTPISITF